MSDKSRVITVRLTVDEHEELKAEAWKRKLSLQKYCHLRLFGLDLPQAAVTTRKSGS